MNLFPLEKTGVKAVDQVLSTIRRDEFNKEVLLKKIKTFADCNRIWCNIVHKNFVEYNFEEKYVPSRICNLSSKTYVRNVVDVLTGQIK